MAGPKWRTFSIYNERITLKTCLESFGTEVGLKNRVHSLYVYIWFNAEIMGGIEMTI